MLKKFLIGLFVCVSANAHETAGYLPLGDGHISTSAKAGYIFSCQTNFHGGGAYQDGSWIVGDKWNPNGKPSVQGNVMWPDHSLTIAVEGDRRVVKSNDLPDHATGIFPISSSDLAFAYDRNPNSIIAQKIVLSMPTNPKIAAEPSCLPMGLIGVALTGVSVFNGLDAQGRDAAAHEVQDSCNGHPERQGAYHYHNMSPCMKDGGGKQGKHSDLAGYAADGFGIYGQFGEGGKSLSNKDLDACHGHMHLLTWNGVPQEIYHYHLTKEYPYTLGCFRGEVSGNKSVLPAKKDGPWAGAGPESHRLVLEKAAQELGVDQDKLRRAIGAPPPNFARAAQQLGIDESKIRAAFDKARR